MQVDDVRNFLFEVVNGAMTNAGLDLALLNMKRGRDHGLVDFNDFRQALGLPRLANFSELTSDSDLAYTLEVLYDTIDDIDLWTGCLSEVRLEWSRIESPLSSPLSSPLPFPLPQDHINDEASLGETLFTAFKLQFELLRDGDRFFYLNDPALLDLLALLDLSLEEFEDIKLSDIILLNTEVEQIQENVFVVDAAFASQQCETAEGDEDDDEEDSAPGRLGASGVRTSIELLTTRQGPLTTEFSLVACRC